MKSRSDKLRRCYYSMAKEVFDGRLNNASAACRSSKRWLYLRDISVLIYGLRLFVIKWLWENDFKGEELLGIDVLKYDVVCNYLNAHKDQLDPFFCVVLYLFGLFEFSCQHAYHSLNADTPTWRWWYELVVVNQDQYYEASLDNAKTEKIFRKREAEIMQKWTKERKYLWATLMPRFLVELLAKLQARIAIWTGLETVDKEKLFSKLFQVVPGLSPRIRTRVLLWLIAFDKICYFLQGGLAFLFFTVLVFAYTDGDYTLHPWYVIIWLLWEYLFTFLVALRMCRSAMFFTICTLLGTIVYTGHVIEVGRSVWTLIRENECNGVHEEKEEEEEAMMVGGKIPLTQHTVLYNELHEHNLVCFLVVDGCETLFGSVLMAFLLTNIPINIYFLQRSVFVSQTYVNLFVIWVVIICQAGAGALVLGPLSWCCEVYHAPKRFIPKLQLMLRPGKAWLFYKLKYDDLYNRLVQGPKMAVSIGPVESVTYQSSLQFLFMYIAYVLMGFSQMIETKKTRSET